MDLILSSFGDEFLLAFMIRLMMALDSFQNIWLSKLIHPLPARSNPSHQNVGDLASVCPSALWEVSVLPKTQKIIEHCLSIVSTKHIDGIFICYDCVFAAPGTHKLSQGRRSCQQCTVLKVPKLSIRYLTLSKQMWSKPTLRATLESTPPVKVPGPVRPPEPPEPAIPVQSG